MTIEELQAELEETKLALDAVSSNNKKLVSELKNARAQNKEVDSEKYFAMQDELETLKNEHDKLNKLHKTETERLSKGLNEKESYLQKLIVDDGLTNALTKAGVKPEYLDATKALLREKTALKENGGKYEAQIGDKPLSDYIGEWAATDSGKAFIAAPQNTGGGATGGGSSGGQKSFKDMSEGERNTLYRENPQLFEQMAKGS